uniref:Uncharacterized protein n=1 Tax=Meloidogyne floridensis TaxID=298350 RepID=A0A915NJR2_9BILA
MLWEGELLTIDQIEGHVVNHPQAETITLDQLNGSSLPTLDTLIFKNLELTNDSDPTIRLLASFRTFARGQHMQAIHNSMDIVGTGVQTDGRIQHSIYTVLVHSPMGNKEDTAAHQSDRGQTQ